MQDYNKHRWVVWLATYFFKHKNVMCIKIMLSVFLLYLLNNQPLLQ